MALSLVPALVAPALRLRSPSARPPAQRSGGVRGTLAPDVSVCIANWNCKDYLRICLRSLLDLPQDATLEIIVVDNASTDGAADMVTREFPEVLLIRNDTNLGFARASNQAAEFAIEQGFYIAAFNHLTPFPGTPLYQRLQREGRLLHERWWLDERYRYNDLPFRPAHMAPDEVRHQCIDARKRFYSWKSMIRRAFDPVNRRENFMFRNFFLINGMHRAEVSTRDQFPLGDPLWRGELLTVA